MVNELPIKNFLTRLSELKLESGTTGASRIRRMPFALRNNSPDEIITSEGSFGAISHVILADAQTKIIYYTPVILPSDYIRGGFPSINILWMNDGTSGDVLWVIKVVAFKPGDTTETLCVSKTSIITVPGIANTMALLSVDLTFLPEPNSFIHVLIQRSGGSGLDTNSDESQLYSTFLEYLAHS